MKAIKELIKRIDEELADAQCYAEKYVETKAEGQNEWASNFRTMAENELSHATKMHEYAVMKIDKINQVYKPKQEMLDKWEKAHKEYVDQAAWIKQMLTM